MRKLGDSNPRYGKPVRQFSKLVVSATHPNFLNHVLVAFSLKRGAKVRLILKLTSVCYKKTEKMCVFGPFRAVRGLFQGVRDKVLIVS